MKIAIVVMPDDFERPTHILYNAELVLETMDGEHYTLWKDAHSPRSHGTGAIPSYEFGAVLDRVARTLNPTCRPSPPVPPG